MKIIFIAFLSSIFFMNCSIQGKEKEIKILEIINSETYQTYIDFTNSYIFNEAKKAEKDYLDNGKFKIDTLKLTELLNKLNIEFIHSDFLNIVDSESAISNISTSLLISLRRVKKEIQKNKKGVLNSEYKLKSRILYFSILENNIEYINKTLNLELEILKGLVKKDEINDLKRKISVETSTRTY